MADRSTLIVAAYITHSPHSANNTHTRTLSVQPDPGTAQMCIRHGCSVRRVRWWFVLKMHLLYPPLYSARCILLNISNELNMFILYEFCYSPASTRVTHTHTRDTCYCRWQCTEYSIEQFSSCLLRWSLLSFPYINFAHSLRFDRQRYLYFFRVAVLWLPLLRSDARGRLPMGYIQINVTVAMTILAMNKN